MNPPINYQVNYFVKPDQVGTLEIHSTCKDHAIQTIKELFPSIDRIVNISIAPEWDFECDES